MQLLQSARTTGPSEINQVMCRETQQQPPTDNSGMGKITVSD